MFDDYLQVIKTLRYIWLIFLDLAETIFIGSNGDLCGFFPTYGRYYLYFIENEPVYKNKHGCELRPIRYKDGSDGYEVSNILILIYIDIDNHYSIPKHVLIINCFIFIT